MKLIPTRREFLKVIGVALSAPVLHACGGGGDGEGTQSGSIQPNLTNPQVAKTASNFWIYSDPRDARIVGGQTTPGENFTLLGIKGSGGRVQDVSGLLFLNNAGAASFAELNPKQSRLTGISDNISMTLSNLVADGINVQLLAGNQQLSLKLPSATVPASAVKGAMSAAALHALSPTMLSHSKRTGTLAMTIKNRECQPCSVSKAQSGQATQSPVLAPIVDVDVLGCVGDDPNVVVYMRDEAGKLLDVSKAVLTGEGKYTAVLTNVNSSDEAFSAFGSEAIELMKAFGVEDSPLSSIVAYLKGKTIDAITDDVIQHLKSQNKFADTYEQFAPFLNATDEAVDEVRKIANFKVFLGKALGTMFKAIDVIDRFKQAIQGGITLASFIDAYAAMQFNQLQLQAVVKTSKGMTFTGVGSGLIAPEGPYPTLSVQTSGDLDISALALNPPSPAGFQGYVATGIISCQVTGDTVIMSVLGTDGYHDETSTLVTGDGSQEFTLAVPGGDSGVSDVVTMRVLRNNQEMGRRIASLVFG